MKFINIQDAMQQSPFRPFLLQSGGKELRVDHPEQVAFSASKSTLVVFSRDDRIHILDVDHISAMTLLPNRRKITASI
jgi:hypothetical protein